MRSLFIGYFRPKDEELEELWKNCVFIFDANVLLNLYRYSPETRKELEKAINSIKERSYIPYQVAKEFLKNRLLVTAGQANEYTKAIKHLNELSESLSNKDRHPFLADEDLTQFIEFSTTIVSKLETQQKSLLAKFSQDEILDNIGDIFTGKTGEPNTEQEIEKFAKEGEDRYKNNIPPGYRDNKKDTDDDSYRIYGDLIVWKQIINYAKTNKCPIIFVTDDKKDDWWLEQSGKTIGPRPELIEEFYKETSQNFWMYSVEKFIQYSAMTAKSIISDEVIEEIRKISLQSNVNEYMEVPSITISQDISQNSDIQNSGILTVSIHKKMKYATGTGKFNPVFGSIPKIKMDIISSPYPDNSNYSISYGCGTIKNFNVHIKALNMYLEPGDYIFKYDAKIDNAEICLEQF